MWRLLALLLAVGVTNTNAVAEIYTEKPIKLIVPFPEQSPADLLARILARKLQAGLGQAVTVHNVPGLSGTRGLGRVARAAPNGYTIGLASDAALTTNLLIYRDLPYDPVNDFAPIGRLIAVPNVFVVSHVSPFKTLQDVIRAAKARRGQLTFAHAGTGSSGHVAGQMLMIRSHIDLKPIAATNTDEHRKVIEDDQVSFGILSILDAVPLVKKGTLRPLAVTSSERSGLLPDVPALAECGFPGYEAGAWFGLVAPRGTPGEIIDRLNAEATKSLRLSGLGGDLTAIGAQVVAGSPDEMGERINGRLAELRPLLQLAPDDE